MLYVLTINIYSKDPNYHPKKKKGEKKLLVQIMELFLLLYSF